MILFCFTLSFALFIIHNESFNGAFIVRENIFIIFNFSRCSEDITETRVTCASPLWTRGLWPHDGSSWWWPHDGSHLLRLSKPQTEAAAAGLGVDTVIAILRTARLVRKWADGRVSPNRGLRKSEYCCCCLLRWEFWDSECWITRLNVQLKAGNKLSCFCAPLT